MWPLQNAIVAFRRTCECDGREFCGGGRTFAVARAVGFVGGVVWAVSDDCANDRTTRTGIGGARAGSELNIDENPVTAARYSVQSIPTLLIFQNGEVKDRIIGASPKAEIARRLQAVLG